MGPVLRESATFDRTVIAEIQRAARDISVATGHVLHDRTAAVELHGRMLLGMQPQPTLY